MPSEGAARRTAVKMGSRWKAGAVPATVSGERLPDKRGSAQGPASQETCLRRRPRPAGISLRRVAPLGPCARAAPPRRHLDVSFQEVAMNILILISAVAAQAADDPAIVVTASRAPVAAEDSAASVDIFGEDAIDDLALPALPDLLRLS